MAKSINYRKLAFEHYPPICAYCGFGIPEILQIAHVNHNHQDNAIENLVVLCPTCHKMYDGNLIPRDVILLMRDNPRKLDWSASMKDAGIKAAKKRKARQAAKKAVETRRKKKDTKIPS